MTSKLQKIQFTQRLSHCGNYKYIFLAFADSRDQSTIIIWHTHTVLFAVIGSRLPVKLYFGSTCTFFIQVRHPSNLP